MKTLKKLIAALLIALFCMSTALASGAIRTDGEVNVRKGPGLDYAASYTLSSGTVKNYDKTAKDERGVTWYHLVNGGWVSSKFTTRVDSSSASKSTSSTKNTVKATGKVNLRKGPGLDYKSLGTIHTGETAKYLGETKKDERGVAWYKVSFNGKTGWVSSKYAKLNK